MNVLFVQQVLIAFCVDMNSDLWVMGWATQCSLFTTTAKCKSYAQQIYHCRPQLVRLELPKTPSSQSFCSSSTVIGSADLAALLIRVRACCFIKLSNVFQTHKKCLPSINFQSLPCFSKWSWTMTNKLYRVLPRYSSPLTLRTSFRKQQRDCPNCSGSTFSLYKFAPSISPCAVLSSILVLR